MCDVCRAFDRKQPKKILIPHEVPDPPWAKFGADLLTYRDRKYLICVDYYSSFWEINPLDNTTGNPSKEAVNVKVERCVRTRSFEGGCRRWSQISSK